MISFDTSTLVGANNLVSACGAKAVRIPASCWGVMLSNGCHARGTVKDSLSIGCSISCSRIIHVIVVTLCVWVRYDTHVVAQGWHFQNTAKNESLICFYSSTVIY